MIARKHWRRSYQDNLLIRVITHNGQTIVQGKRLPDGASDLLKEVQRAYVKSGIIGAIKVIKEKEHLGLGASLSAFNVLRGSTNMRYTRHEGR